MLLDDLVQFCNDRSASEIDERVLTTREYRQVLNLASPTILGLIYVARVSRTCIHIIIFCEPTHPTNMYFSLYLVKI